MERCADWSKCRFALRAPGCETDRIGYLEAWYVDPDWRNQGMGRALVEQAEAWARAEGCVEMASDTASLLSAESGCSCCVGV